MYDMRIKRKETVRIWIATQPAVRGARLQPPHFIPRELSRPPARPPGPSYCTGRGFLLFIVCACTLVVARPRRFRLRSCYARATRELRAPAFPSFWSSHVSDDVCSRASSGTVERREHVHARDILLQKLGRSGYFLFFLFVPASRDGLYNNIVLKEETLEKKKKEKPPSRPSYKERTRRLRRRRVLIFKSGI